MKPTLRDDYRYVVVRIISSQPMVKEDVEKIIQKELIPIIGIIHFSKVMPKIAFYDYSNKLVIIRCLKEGVEDLKTALSLIKSYEGKPLHLMPIYTSGTIRKAKEKLSC